MKYFVLFEDNKNGNHELTGFETKKGLKEYLDLNVIALNDSNSGIHITVIKGEKIEFKTEVNTRVLLFD